MRYRALPDPYSASFCCFDSKTNAVILAARSRDREVLVAFDANNLERDIRAFRWARRLPFGSVNGLCVVGSEGVVIASSLSGRKLLALDTSTGIQVR